MADEAMQAMRARSLRSIKTELEFLADTAVISQQQLNTILAILPQTPDSDRPNSRTTTTTTSSASNNVRSLAAAANSQPLISPTPTPAPAPIRAASPEPPVEPPTQQLNDMHLFHRSQHSTPQPQQQQQQQAQYSAPPVAPPAYSSVPPVLCIASAVYAYVPTDAGDLELQPNDRVQVTEHMNDDWWRGRNERTGAEGIFPRTYINVIEDKQQPQQRDMMSMPPPPPQFQQPIMQPMQPQPSPGPMAYGNMPMAVAQGPPMPMPAPQPVAVAAPVAAPAPQEQGSGIGSKVEEGGKKFGKKLGNAAIFGAGATIGSNLVNSIF